MKQWRLSAKKRRKIFKWLLIIVLIVAAMVLIAYGFHLKGLEGNVHTVGG